MLKKVTIYQIAIECANFAEIHVQFFQKMVDTQWLYYVVGMNRHYKSLLLSLCDATFEKYPYLSTKLKENILEYDKLPVACQSAINVLVYYIIALEKPSDGDRKIFISHSSADETIVNGFIKNILMAGCGFRRTDIFCTLDHTVIRTGDDFRNEIVKNMKRCDFILCMISDNYRKSEVCQNELGAAWTMERKRVLPFKFPNLGFSEIGFLNVVKQAADITDRSKLDELYDELCQRYDLQQDWRNYNMLKDEFVELVNKENEQKYQ